MDNEKDIEVQIERNNCVNLVGRIVTVSEFSHELYGEKFYTVIMETRRLSGNYDKVKLMVSDVFGLKDDVCGENVKIEGTLRTHNEHCEDGTHLSVYVFVEEFEIIKGDFCHGDDINIVTIEGFICKKPDECRMTPLGRKIADVIIVSTTYYNKSHYIPSVFWGRNAMYVTSLSIGDKIRVIGRIQSRDYTKNDVIKTAYELSVQKVEPMIIKDYELLYF